jgi:hypothetical protein
MTKVFDPSQPVLLSDQLFFEQISLQSAKGSLAEVVIRPDSYVCSGSTHLRVVYNNSNQEFNIAVISSSLSSTQKVLLTKINDSLYNVSFKESSSAAFAAVPVSSGSRISLQEYQNLNNAGNVIVVTANLVTDQSSILGKAKKTQSNLLSGLVNKKAQTPEVSHQTFSSEAKKSILNSKEEASNSSLGLSLISKDSHIDDEYIVLLDWLKSFSSDKHASSLESLKSYKTVLQSSFESWALWQKTRTSFSGSGHSFSKSTTTKQDEAYSFRFNSGAVIDFFSPSVYTRCEDFSIQGKSYLSVTDLNRQVSTYSWKRAQKLSVLQTKISIDYCTDSLYSYGNDTYRVSSSLLEQADQAKIQVKEELGLLAGQFNSKIENNWVVRAGKLVWQQSSDSTYLVSDKNVFVSSKGENHITSKGETNLVAGSSMYLSSTTSTSVSSGGVLSLSGSMIHIGMGGFGRPILDLDSKKILGGLNSLTSLGISGLSSSAATTASGISINPLSAVSVVTNATKQLGLPELSSFLPSDTAHKALGSIEKSALTSSVTKQTLNLTGLGLGKVDTKTASQLSSQIGKAVASGDLSSLSSKLVASGQKLLANKLTALLGLGKVKDADLPPVPTSSKIPEPNELTDYSESSLPPISKSVDNGWWLS